VKAISLEREFRVLEQSSSLYFFQQNRIPVILHSEANIYFIHLLFFAKLKAGLVRLRMSFGIDLCST
jgi:hypothetical protein